ncbi:MAG: extensin family protein, partial [Pararhodobacter sp.]|nr:extensin family protein [Pararhodobacter sp.]
LAALGGAALAQAPWHSRFPRPRPVQPAAVAPPAMTALPVPQTDAAVAQALGIGRQLTPPPGAPGLTRSPFPRVRPPAAAARIAAALAAARPVAPGGAPATAGPVERGLCGVRALEGRRLPRITSSTRGCGVAEPVSVTAVHGIPLSRAARVDCQLARAFADWVDDAMLPAVGRRGGGVAQIQVIGDYSCRTRNSQRGTRISEHGRGMAIDIAGYRLVNGDVVRVETHWRRRPHRSDLREMFEEACGIFRTTLSPESDRFHQDHLHFDLARHRGGGTYCR